MEKRLLLEEQQREQHKKGFFADATVSILHSKSLDELVERMNELNDHFGCHEQISAMKLPTFGNVNHLSKREDYLSWDDERAIIYVGRADYYDIGPIQTHFPPI